MQSSPSNAAKRYAGWIDTHRWAVLLGAVVVAAVSGMLAFQLPLRPDLSNLLPPQERSVRDLEELKQRSLSFGSAFLIIEARDPTTRERATRAIQRRLEALPPRLVAGVVYDDAPLRRYFWEHRFLFAPLADLRDARDALRAKIDRTKLDANPLYVSLDDEELSTSDDTRIEELRRRLDDADKKAHAPPGFVSTNGKLQLLIVRTAFSSSDFAESQRLLAALDLAIAETGAEFPGVNFGLTGSLIKSNDEHRAVVNGMALAAAITVLLCALALFLYYRSVLPVLASLGALAVGTLFTFGFTKLAIGHLNMVTAFLAAIVVGNGINAGLILLARYFEELRGGRGGNEALAGAIFGATRGTLAASLAAAVAYGSLVVTDFRGFRHFGVIGFVGMVACWIAAFTVLPAALAVLWRWGRIRPHRAPGVGLLLARLLPRRLGRVALFGLALTMVTAGATWHYIATDPLQEDWSDLRPSGTETEAALAWSRRLNDEFTTRFERGQSQRFLIGLERRDQAPAVVARLRSFDDGKPAGGELLDHVNSLDDLLPDRQDEKLALLAEIRTMLADDAVDALTGDDRELIDRIRPPPDLAPLVDDDVPAALAWPFTERDGTRGRLIVATGSLRLNPWNIRDRMDFASTFRSIELPPGAIVGGQSFVFADMFEVMRRDGPRSTLVALFGAILIVGLIVGFGRHGAVTLLCAAAGILGMIALVSLVGLEVNVIDFIALPITIGLGIDYAVNIVARDRQDGGRGAHAVVGTTGGAVLLCSFTTMVGYGSLLLSASGGIRSFGLAAILGEIACVVAALILAPALLVLMRPRFAVAVPAPRHARLPRSVKSARTERGTETRTQPQAQKVSSRLGARAAATSSTSIPPVR